MRELDDMADARLKHDLDGAAIIAATIENVHRPKGKPAISPLERHPYRERQRSGTRMTRQNLGMIAEAIAVAYS